MQLKTDNDGAKYTARFIGELKYDDNGAFRTILDSVTESRTKHCVFDMSGLTSIDSAGLGMLIIASDESKKNGWSLALTGVQGQVKKMLELSRFDQLMTISK